jgi:hypothetical protein
VFSTLATQPPRRKFPIDELFIDFLLGWCSPAVLLLGMIVFRDESFLAAGIFLVPLIHLTIGNLRGSSEGNLWLKAFCICGAILFLFGTGGRLFFVAAGLSLPFTVIGLWLRRRGRLIWQRSGASKKGD